MEEIIHNQAIKDQELEEWKQKAQEYLDGWKRAQADLINYKKEEAKRVQDVIQFGNEAIILQIIDVYDDLNRALSHAPPDIRDKHDAWFQGLHKVVKHFEELLKKYGIEKIDIKSKSFDPEFHEAVHQDSQSQEEGERVLEEYRPGYTMHGKVIRPARVKISR